MMLKARITRNLWLAGSLSRPQRVCALSALPSRTAAPPRYRRVFALHCARQLSSVVDLTSTASEVAVAPTNWSLLSRNCRENAEQRAIAFAVHMSGCVSKQSEDIVRMPRNEALQSASQAAVSLAQELRYESRRLQAHPGMDINAPASALRNLLEEAELWFECASALQGWPTPSGGTGLMSSLKAHSAAQKQLHAQLHAAGSADHDASADAAVLSDAGQRSLLLLPTVSHMPIWGLEAGLHNVLEPQIAFLAMAIAKRLGAAAAPEHRSDGRASRYSPLLRPAVDASLLSSGGLLRLLAPLARSVTPLLSAPPTARVTAAERKGAHAALAFLIESDPTLRAWAQAPRAAATSAAAAAAAAEAAKAAASSSAAAEDVDAALEQSPVGRLAAVVDLLWYLGGPSAGGSRWDTEALASSLRCLNGAAIGAIEDGALLMVKQHFGSHAAAFVAEALLSLHKRQGMRASALFAALLPTLEEEARLLEASLAGSGSSSSAGNAAGGSGSIAATRSEAGALASPEDGLLVVHSAATAPALVSRTGSVVSADSSAAARLGSDIDALSRAARLFSACVALRSLDCEWPSLAKSALKVSLHLLRRLPAPPPLPADVAAAAAGQRRAAFDDGSNEAQEEAETEAQRAEAAAAQHATASAIHGEALRLFTGAFAEAVLTGALRRTQSDAAAATDVDCSFAEAPRAAAANSSSSPSVASAGSTASNHASSIDQAKDGAVISIESCLRTLSAEAREQLVLHFRALESIARVWHLPGQRSRSRRRGGGRSSGLNGAEQEQEPPGSSLLRLLSAEPTNRAMYRLATMSWASLQLARDGWPDAATLGADAAAPVCEVLFPLLQLASSEIREAQAAVVASEGSSLWRGGYGDAAADTVGFTEVLDRIRRGQRTDSIEVQAVLKATGTLHSFYLYAVGAGLLSAEQRGAAAAADQLGGAAAGRGTGSSVLATAVPTAADLQVIQANLAPGWELPADWKGKLATGDPAATGDAVEAALDAEPGLRGYYSGQLFPAWLARLVLAARAWEVANRGVWQPAKHYGRRPQLDAGGQPDIFEAAVAASAEGPTTPIQRALAHMMSRYCDDNGFPQPVLNHYEPSLGVQIPVAWPDQRVAVLPMEAWRYERKPLHELLLDETRRARRPTDFEGRGLPRSLPLVSAGTKLSSLHVREAIVAADIAAKQAAAAAAAPALLSKPAPGTHAGRFGSKAASALVHTVKEGGSQCLAGSPWDGPLVAALALRVAALRASGWHVATLSSACAWVTHDGRWDRADADATARGHLYRQGLWQVLQERLGPEAREAAQRERREASIARRAPAEPAVRTVSTRALAPQQQLQPSPIASPAGPAAKTAPAHGQKLSVPRPPMTPIGLSLKLKAPLPTLQQKPRELADPDSSWYI